MLTLYLINFSRACFSPSNPSGKCFFNQQTKKIDKRNKTRPAHSADYTRMIMTVGRALSRRTQYTLH